MALKTFVECIDRFTLISLSISFAHIYSSLPPPLPSSLSLPWFVPLPCSTFFLLLLSFSLSYTDTFSFPPTPPFFSYLLIITFYFPSILLPYALPPSLPPSLPLTLPPSYPPSLLLFLTAKLYENFRTKSDRKWKPRFSDGRFSVCCTQIVGHKSKTGTKPRFSKTGLVRKLSYRSAVNIQWITLFTSVPTEASILSMTFSMPSKSSEIICFKSWKKIYCVFSSSILSQSI